jgi:type IV pilus assembly protein PilB
LHTNDAPSTLVRLRNMGTASYNIAASVTLITAQRLVRCLCPLCKVPVSLPAEVCLQAGWPAQWLTGPTVDAYRPVGCAHCHKGFAGRTGIFQVMPVSPEMQQLILQEAGSQAMGELAQRERVSTLRLAGLRKVLQGVTSLDEVLANTRSGA